MPKFKEPEVEVKFTSNCFEAVILLKKKKEAGKEATRLRSHISSTSTSNKVQSQRPTQTCNKKE